VSVVNAPFVPGPKFEPEPEQKIWEAPWVLPLAKQVLAGFFILVVVLRVLRPYFKSLAEKPDPKDIYELSSAQMMGSNNEQRIMMNAPEQPLKLPKLSKPGEQSLSHVSDMVKEDPKRVAKVIMNWVGNEDD